MEAQSESIIKSVNFYSEKGKAYMAEAEKTQSKNSYRLAIQVWKLSLYVAIFFCQHFGVNSLILICLELCKYGGYFAINDILL